MKEADQIYLEAIRTWGVHSQLDQAIEEAAELILAIRHFQRGRIDLGPVIEEAADCAVMVDQLRIILGAERFDAVKDRKIHRLGARLEVARAIGAVSGKEATG